MTELPERTALYRLYDAEDRLLYVGITNDPDFRWKAHLYSSKPWPKQVARHEIEWHSSRRRALKAEVTAIQAERPLHNGKHNYDDAPFDPATWPHIEGHTHYLAVADLMRAEIRSGRWAHEQRIPSARTLANAAGVQMRSVGKASALLRQEGLLNFQAGHGLFVGADTTSPASEPTLTRVTRTLETKPARASLTVRLPHDWPRQLGWPG